MSTRRCARHLSPQSARIARDAGAGGGRNRGLCCQGAGPRIFCNDRPPLRHRVQRARRAVQPSLFRPCRAPRFADRVGSLTEGAPRRTTPGTLRLPPNTVFRSSAARRQTPDISVSHTVPRVLWECQFLDENGIFGGLHQTVSKKFIVEKSKIVCWFGKSAGNAYVWNLPSRWEGGPHCERR